MRKLWIVTELFYPDETSTSYILSKIANRLTDKYEVNVISGSAFYQKNKEIKNNCFLLDKKINVFKVQTKESDKNKLIHRTIKICSLTIKLSFALWKNVSKNDKVFIVTNPAPLLIVISFLKRLMNFELCVLVHDVFPENTIPAKIIKSKTSLIYRFIMIIFNWAYSSVDSLIVLGRDMKDVLNNKLSRFHKPPKIEIVENWADTDNIVPLLEEVPIISTRHSKNIITLQYAGNIGRTQGINEFIRIFNKTTNKNIHFDLWGDGAMKDNLVEYVNKNNLNNRITFNGVYSRSEQNDILNSTDIALITLSIGMYGLGVPSKTYNILASGKPILFIGDLKSEIALMIQEYNIGFCFHSKDIISIKEFLDKLCDIDINVIKEMGIKARLVAETIYCEKVIIDKYISVI